MRIACIKYLKDMNDKTNVLHVTLQFQVEFASTNAYISQYPNYRYV